ncbi:hypothetical protein ACFL6C_13295 [Myxococcota bacterium]
MIRSALVMSLLSLCSARCSQAPAPDAAPAPPVSGSDSSDSSAQGGMRLVTESPPWLWDRPWETALRILGGVEISGNLGTAGVTSGVTDEEDVSYDVASGSARQLGWGISLYWAPESTGFFLRPTFGYLSQEIDIADFRADLPLENVPDSYEIAGRCQSVDSGEVIDCDAPNTYALHMQSLFVGVRGGYALVIDASGYSIIAFLGGGANLLEYRSIDAQVASFESDADGWAPFRSVGAEGSVGMHYPDIHLSVRLIVGYDYYFGFSYAEPLNFLGPVVFDPDVGQNRRPVVRVKDARLDAWTLRLATAFVF